MCAIALNGQVIGGKKRHNLFHDDMWTIKYLPKFKWQNLTEKLAYDQKTREQRLKVETNQSRKEVGFYLEKVDLKKRLDKMQEKKMEKLKKQAGVDDVNDSASEQEDGDKGKQKKAKNLLKMMKYHQRNRREFKQREPITQ